MPLLKIFQSTYFYLTVIIIIGLWARLYDINRAVADWHAWRQADTAAVSKLFYEDGFNPLYPKYFDLSDVSQTGKVNLEGYRFVEFPLYNSIVYASYLIHGGVDVMYARLVSVLFSIGAIVFLFLLVKKYWGRLNALLSALTFAVLPYSVFYSREVLPDASMIFLGLGGFYFTDKWVWENKWRYFVLGVLFCALALLVRPYAFFYFLPLLYSMILKEKRILPIPRKYFIFLILAVLPLGLWRIWIEQHPEGIPASDWLFNGNGIRFKPAFWKWIIGERLGREILGATGTLLLGLGFLSRPENRKSILLYLFGLSSLLYIIVVATGNVQHDYYQYITVPALAMFVGRGMTLLLKGSSSLLPKIFSIPIAIFLFILMIYLTFLEVQGLYQINNDSIVIAGEEANKILPKSAVVIAPYGGDTSFLYYVNRQGFAYIISSVDEMKKQFGVTDYVSVNFDDQTNKLMKEYKILEKTPQFVIIDLTQKQI